MNDLAQAYLKIVTPKTNRLAGDGKMIQKRSTSKSFQKIIKNISSLVLNYPI